MNNPTPSEFKQPNIKSGSSPNSAKSVAETYSSGYDLRFAKDITYSDYWIICQKLSTKFNQHFDIQDEQEKYLFKPEAIDEGGIQMVNFPQKTAKMYKTFRHHINLGTSGNYIQVNWPWITEESLKKWKDSNDLLIPEKSRATTVLKAFYGAPIWTLKELKIFKEILSEFGIKCVNCPKARDLKSYNQSLG